MTQHPFDREYSEPETQKLNSESTSPANKDELTDEEAEDVAGGSIPFTAPRLEGGISSPTHPSCPVTKAGVWEGGGRFLSD